MAESRSRSDKKPFKPKTKEQMEEDLQKMQIAQLKRPEPNFKEIPTWDKASSFQITGEEFEHLYSFYQMYSPIFSAIERIFHRGVAKGLVKPVYLREDGTEAPQEEVEAFRKEMMEYINKVNHIRGVKPPKPEIVGVNGEPLESENSEEKPTE